MQRLSEQGKRYKNDYIREYNKENKKIFSARLKNEEYEEICDYLQRIGMNKAEFIRYAYEQMLSGKI